MIGLTREGVTAFCLFPHHMTIARAIVNAGLRDLSVAAAARFGFVLERIGESIILRTSLP